MDLIGKIAQPGFNVNLLSWDEKTKLVRETDGVLSCILEGITIKGNLWLDGCRLLVSLPEGLRVNGHLWLRECTLLTRLPEDLDVSGNLDLDGCCSLTQFPNSVDVGGDLILRGCPAEPHGGIEVRGRIVR